MDKTDLIFVTIIAMCFTIVGTIMITVNLYAENQKLEREYGYAMELLDMKMKNPESYDDTIEKIKQYKAIQIQI